MSLRTVSEFRENAASFNMTAVIDIVFLLIIFFLVVCQFIEAENFPVSVPDGLEFAESVPENRTGMTTVTVMKTDEERIEFAVGSEKVKASDSTDMIKTIAELIDTQVGELSAENRIVNLRIDKDVCFAEAQYALAAVAVSSATDIQLAVLKNK